MRSKMAEFLPKFLAAPPLAEANTALLPTLAALAVFTAMILGVRAVIRRRRHPLEALIGARSPYSSTPSLPMAMRGLLPRRVHPLAGLVGFAFAGYMLMLATESSQSVKLRASVTHVRDGDTIVVSGTPIRFAQLDCAELGTSAGEDAKRRMQQLVVGQRLECRLSGRRSYDRKIGECYLEDGRSLSSVLIAEGFCSRWR
jgi:hypothetical protein